LYQKKEDADGEGESPQLATFSEKHFFFFFVVFCRKRKRTIVRGGHGLLILLSF
jgi:hypothetical protein